MKKEKKWIVLTKKEGDRTTSEKKIRNVVFLGLILYVAIFTFISINAQINLVNAQIDLASANVVNTLL